MPDLYDADYGSRIFDLVDDPIWALADAVSILTGEFLGARRSRLLGKLGDTIDDEPTLLPGR